MITHALRSAGIVAACLGAGLLGGAVPSPRSPLTFRDSGLYANLDCIHGVSPAEDGVTSLLSAERAARSSTPWDFYIMQYNAKGPDADRARRLQALAENGKKVILRVLLGKEGQVLDTDRAKERLNDVFVHTRPEWVHAITLDEENVYWHGNTPRLVELYRYAKERWPDLPVYQWWTPMIAPEVDAERGWIALPADGWVMDLYGRHAEEFEKKLLKFLETGKPLVHIAWASPTWMFHDREGYTKEDWWARAGRPVFDEQVRICREYGVPVAYFCAQQAEFRDGKRIAPIRWGWHATCPATRRWFRELEMVVANFDYLPADVISFRRPSPALFAWAHSDPGTTVRLELTEHAQRRVTWRTTFGAGTALGEGMHPLPRPYGNPYVGASYVLDASATYLREGLNVASIDKRVCRVPIVFRVEPLQPLLSCRITATVTVTKSLGGQATLEWSRDGTTWSEPVYADAATTRPQDLEAYIEAAADGPLRQPLLVRLTLIASAGVRSNIATRLRALSASGVLPEEP